MPRAKGSQGHALREEERFEALAGRPRPRINLHDVPVHELNPRHLGRESWCDLLFDPPPSGGQLWRKEVLRASLVAAPHRSERLSLRVIGLVGEAMEPESREARKSR